MKLSLLDLSPWQQSCPASVFLSEHLLTLLFSSSGPFPLDFTEQTATIRQQLWHLLTFFLFSTLTCFENYFKFSMWKKFINKDKKYRSSPLAPTVCLIFPLFLTCFILAHSFKNHQLSKSETEFIPKSSFFFCFLQIQVIFILSFNK